MELYKVKHNIVKQLQLHGDANTSKEVSRRKAVRLSD